jgi:phosphoribosylaminoimidazole carboxylase PurE protein
MGREQLKPPKVLILVGSKSDLETMQKSVEILEKLQIGVTIEVSSAHRQPEETSQRAKNAAADGYSVIICGAGLSAALPGFVASHTPLPVLGVPLDASGLGGLDALLAVSQMPKGVPVGCLAIGSHGAANAALLAARIIALSDQETRRHLEEYQKQLASST